jgi:DNA-binding transcriptional LysR family regulator
MDQLRALRYFAAAARRGSFTRAAAYFGVSVPAVQRLVDGLEQGLGVKLLVRTATGLTLTPVGQRYLFDVEAGISQIDNAQRRLTPADGPPTGVVVVAAAGYLIEHVFEPHCAAFFERFPHVRLDFRVADHSINLDRHSVDIFLGTGWFETSNMVRKTLRVSEFQVVGSPEFFAKYGTPEHPSEIEELPAVGLRTHSGTLMDLWDFSRGNEHVQVRANCVVSFDNSQRDAYMSLVTSGLAVARSLDFLQAKLIAAGKLIRILDDWIIPDAPALDLFFRPEARDNAATSAVIDFLVERCSVADNGSRVRLQTPPSPRWSGKGLERASMHGRR